ncbi:hypothetical protein LCGC14_1663580, partial [marine sediment metagenome]
MVKPRGEPGNDNPPPKMPYIPRQRGDERRLGKADRRDFANRRCAPDSGRTYATQRGDRRESQRRKESTTLVEALKR